MKWIYFLNPEWIYVSAIGKATRVSMEVKVHTDRRNLMCSIFFKPKDIAQLYKLEQSEVDRINHMAWEV